MTDRQRILDRLTKLVAMSKSPNRHEAETAGRMAVELAKRHGIDERELAEHTPGGLIEKPMGAKGFEKVWKFSLITATARFCGCEAIGLHAGTRRKVRLVGERVAVDEAAQLFEELMATMAELIKAEAEWLDKQPIELLVSPSAYADSYRRGVTLAIIDKMRKLQFQRRAETPYGDAEGTPPEGGERFESYANVLPATGLVKIAKPSTPRSDYQEKVKAKYAPKKANLALEDAEDEGAFWRGYQTALSRIELTPGSNQKKKES